MGSDNRDGRGAFVPLCCVLCETFVDILWLLFWGLIIGINLIFGFQEGYKVLLNVYDLSQGLARQLSSSFPGSAIEGIW